MQALIKIGTRGSKLALWQAYYVQDKLKAAGFDTEIVIITTKGDQILDRSLSKIGSKGVFTEELEEQLRDGSIDIAVHSAKDLSSELPADLEIIAFTERERANDVLISFNKTLSLKEPIHIGTSSTRRKALLRHLYPHIQTSDVRGNLQTRIEKLKSGQYDALLLAYAGVHRMDNDDLIVHHFSLDEFTPAVGQGSVAIEAAKTMDSTLKNKIALALNHEHTAKALRLERSFLKTINGGCSIPVFGHATLNDNTLHLRAGIVSLDGTQLIVKTASGNVSDYEQMGADIANEILESGGREILEEIRR